jgi:transposase
MARDEPMIPDAAPGTRPHRAPKREIVEAILYLLRAGCS